MPFENYQDPIISRRRKGSTDDPFQPLTQTEKVRNGVILLTEIPNKFRGLTIKDGTKTLSYKDGGLPDSNTVIVDWTNGILKFDATNEGKTLIVDYYGEGQILYPSSKIYTETDELGNVVSTLRDLTDDTIVARDTTQNLNDTVSLQEDIREQNEDTRQTNESTRSNAETQRASNESTRIGNENTRKNAETTRVNNENERIQNESERESAEALRISAENARIQNESNRVAVDQAAIDAANYANEQGDYAKGIRANFGHKGDYSSTATYKNGNVVTYGGINYFCIQDTTAGIDPLNGAYWTVVSPQASINDQTWTATEGQTVFTIINGNYVVNQGNIEVWVGGVPQVSGVGYTETNSTTITLSEGVTSGTTVFAKWYEGHISITKGHKSSHALGGQDEIDVTQLRNFKEKVTDEFTSVSSQLADIAVNVSNYSGTDTQKLQNSMNASEGKTLNLGVNKTYIIDSTINGVSNIKIIGQNVTIKIADNVRLADGMFRFLSKQNVVIEGITFDQNMQNMPVYQGLDYNKLYNVGVYGELCTNIEIEKCKFINLYNQSVYLYNCSGRVNIKSNYFHSPLQPQWYFAEHIALGSFADVAGNTINIENNVIENENYTDPAYGVQGIYCFNVKCKTTIVNNKLINCGRDNTGTHRLSPIDLYQGCDNFYIAKNIIISNYGCLRISRSKNVKFVENHVEFNFGAGESALSVRSDNSDASTTNIQINRNYFQSNATTQFYLMNIDTGDWGRPNSNIEICDNTAVGRFDEFISLKLPYNNVLIKGNKTLPDESGNATKIPIEVEKPSVALTTTYATEATSTGKNLIIEKNDLYFTTSLTVTTNGYTGTADEVIFKDNNLMGDTTNAYLLHAFAKMKIQNCNLKNALVGVYLRVNGNFITGLTTNNCTTPINAPGVTVVGYENNWFDGVQQFTGSIVWDPGALVDGAGETSATITVNGVGFGDMVLVGVPYDLFGVQCTGYIEAANKVRIRLQNETGATRDFASGTWKVKVIHV